MHLAEKNVPKQKRKFDDLLKERFHPIEDAKTLAKELKQADVGEPRREVIVRALVGGMSQYNLRAAGIPGGSTSSASDALKKAKEENSLASVLAVIASNAGKRQRVKIED